DLSSGRFEQIVPADDERDALAPVVDRRRELIGPVALAIPREQVPALRRRPLLAAPVPEIDERFDGRVEANANTESGCVVQPAIAAGARIAKFVFGGSPATDRRGNLRARADACVRQPPRAQRVARRLVERDTVALA